MATSTTNSGAFNGVLNQVMRGHRRFLSVLGAPTSHANTEFAITVDYKVANEVSQKFTESTENTAVTKTHTNYSNSKNTFTFMKGGVELTQTRLNAAKYISPDNALNEVGGNWMLTDAWQAQWLPFLSGFVKDINKELINGEYVEFTESANNTRGLIEAAQIYTDTNFDASGVTDAKGLIEVIEDMFVAMRKEGVTLEATPVFYPNQISGTEADTPVAATMKALCAVETRLKIERMLREGGDGIFTMERNSTDAGVAINRLITSFGILEFIEDEDMPADKLVIAKFAEMRPVYQSHNSIGEEGRDGEVSPEGAMLRIVRDMTKEQGIGVNVYTRVGLNHGATNRIAFIDFEAGAPAK